MSFFDDASLVFLPSGQAGKDGKAYSMKPTNGDGDFTFSRGSNLTATRVDSNGLIEKGRENLLKNSNSFNPSGTAWNPTTGYTFTSGQEGYDGSNNAWLLDKLNTLNDYFQQRSIVGMSGNVVTESVYAKAGTEVGLMIFNPNGYARWNLSNGTLISEGGNPITSSIESVGNGWYRCSLTVDGDSSYDRMMIKVVDSNAADSSGSIYIQDAQLELGLVATEYIESGATTGLAGILEDSPRFDYSGGASCPSLLLEPSRTNLLQSEYFDGWNLFNEMTPTANNATSPEGLQNAYKMETTAAGAYFRDAQTLTAGNNVFSIFVKRGNSQYIFLRTRFFTGGDNADVWFDVQNGTKGGNLGDSVTYDIEDYGNGWYRCYLVHNVDAGDLFGYAYVGLTNTDEDTSGESSLNGYFYGGQWEEGSYPTSYIPNHSGGSVTRAADVNTLLNQSGVIGQTAGTILFDAYFDEADKVNFSISDSTSSNYILIDTTSGKQVFARVQQGGSTQATISTSGSFFTEGDRLKCAIAYDDRDMAFYINGTQVGTAAPNLIPACDDIRFTRWNGALAYAADQRVNRVVLFDTRISNGNLATLTS